MYDIRIYVAEPTTFLVVYVQREVVNASGHHLLPNKISLNSNIICGTFEDEKKQNKQMMELMDLES